MRQTSEEAYQPVIDLNLDDDDSEEGNSVEVDSREGTGGEGSSGEVDGGEGNSGEVERRGGWWRGR